MPDVGSDDVIHGIRGDPHAQVSKGREADGIVSSSFGSGFVSAACGELHS